MSIVHEAVCDGCGKREPAVVGSLDLGTETRHPDGWFLVAIAGAQYDDRRVTRIYQGYCSRRCVALGEVVEPEVKPLGALTPEDSWARR